MYTRASATGSGLTSLLHSLLSTHVTGSPSFIVVSARLASPIQRLCNAIAWRGRHAETGSRWGVLRSMEVMLEKVRTHGPTRRGYPSCWPLQSAEEPREEHRKQYQAKSRNVDRTEVRERDTGCDHQTFVLVVLVHGVAFPDAHSNALEPAERQD